MLKIFCAITGDDFNLVKVDTPESKKKISALASVLLIPVTTWFVIGFSIGYTILQLSAITSFGIGFLTSSIIFIVERVIIMSGPNLFLVSLRILIGLIIAMLGSVFIDEVIFKDDIEQQVYLDKKDMIQQERQRIHSVMDPIMQQAQFDTDRKQNLWNKSLTDVTTEADGTGGSGVRSYGKIAKLKEGISKRYEDEYLASKATLIDLQSQSDAQLHEVAKGIDENITGRSILFRIKSLFKLVFSDHWVLGVYILFTLLLFVLEFIVIIMKYSLPETGYEKRVKTMEMIQKSKLDIVAERQAKSFDRTDEILENANPGLYKTQRT